MALAAVSALLGLAFSRPRSGRARGSPRPPASARSRPGRVAPGGRARLGDVVRPSANPRIVYELIPGLDVELLGARLRTTPDGFRGEAVTPARTRPAVRVVGLGDSVMFGWGVREEDSYLARMAAMLEASSPGVAWEVVNTAVPGYNTVMEVETLEAKGLRFDPDLVVLNFVGNDLGLPNFIEERPEVLSLRRSFLLDFVRGRLRGEPDAGPRLVGVPAEVRRFGEAHLDRVPARYRGLLGPEAWRAAMDRLRALSRAHGFEVVVLAHPEVFGFARDTARELGFPAGRDRPEGARLGPRAGDRGRPEAAAHPHRGRPAPLRGRARDHRPGPRRLAPRERGGGRLASRRLPPTPAPAP